MTKQIMKKILLGIIVLVSGAFIMWQGGTVDWGQLFKDAMSGEGSNIVQQVEDLQ